MNFKYAPEKRFVVSETGEVRRVKDSLLIKPYVHVGRGAFYLRIALGKKKWFVHILVWKTFMGPIPEGFQVDHIDRNGFNNNINNLRLVTQKENLANRRKYNSHKIDEDGKIRDCGTPVKDS